jgi:hypothetical protein
MRAFRISSALAFACIATLVACGGGTSPPASPSQAPSRSAPADSDGDGVPDSKDATPTSTDLTARSNDKAVRARARSDLDRAERELEASTGDCAAACRALGSMERATTHLCEIAQSSAEDGPRCDDAQRKVRAAREHIRSTCGACPGGT